jgi:hypothetical protein
MRRFRFKERRNQNSCTDIGDRKEEREREREGRKR